jgi:predicted nucleic acid-binding protein
VEWRLRNKKVERNSKVKEYVLDTSIVIKWFSEYDEDDLQKALDLRYKILEGRCFVVVPDLLFYELSNALRYNPHFTADDVAEAVNTVMDMGFDVKGIEHETVERAVEIAFQYNVSVYDAYFLALSRKEKKPFVTADHGFYEKAKKLKNIIKLSYLD